jgi:hypothetical protein
MLLDNCEHRSERNVENMQVNKEGMESGARANLQVSLETSGTASERE